MSDESCPGCEVPPKFIPAPRYLSELHGKMRCTAYGDLVVCVQGTAKYPSPSSVFTGRPSSLVRVCFFRESKPEEVICVRAYAPPNGVGKADVVSASYPFETGFKNLATLADYRAGLALGLDRNRFRDRLDMEYTEVVNLSTGAPDWLAARIVSGRGRVLRKNFLSP